MFGMLGMLAESGSGFGLLVGGLIGVLSLIVSLLATIFWLWMIIDALIHEPTPGDKILWFLVIFFLWIIGAIIYFVLRKRGPRRTLFA